MSQFAGRSGDVVVADYVYVTGTIGAITITNGRGALTLVVDNIVNNFGMSATVNEGVATIVGGEKVVVKGDILRIVAK